MKKLITTLSAVTFALGLAAAAPAQVAKTPEKPVAPITQATPSTVAPQETAKPDVKTTAAVKPGDENKVGQPAKKKAKKVGKPAKTLKGAVEKKAGAPLATPQGGAK